MRGTTYVMVKMSVLLWSILGAVWCAPDTYLQRLETVCDHLRAGAQITPDEYGHIIELVREWATVHDTLSEDACEQGRQLLRELARYLQQDERCETRAPRIETTSSSYAPAQILLPGIDGQRDAYFRTVQTENLIVTSSLVSPVLNYYVLRTGDSMTGPLVMDGGVGIVFEDSTDSNSMTLQAPTALTTTYTLYLPVSNGLAGQVLATDANGQLSWQTVSTGTGGGILTLNGLSAPAQHLVVGTAGAAFNIQDAVDTHTFNLPSANTPGVTGGTVSYAQVQQYNTAYSAVSAATSAPTPNTLVLRDATGSSTFNKLTLMSGLLLDNGSSVVYYNTANNQSLTLTGSSVITTYTLSWPTAIGATNQLLTLGAGGQLGWSTMFTPTSGIYSLNGLTTPVQTFTTNQSTPNFHITSSGSTHTFSLPSANNPATTDGTISNSQVVNYNTAYSAVSTATSNNVANTLVLRDGSGNFSASTITANLTGTATFATNAQSAVTSTTAQFFTGSLAGDVTGTEFSTVVAFVGGQSAANVASATTKVLTATSAPTANTLVLRDATGSFTTNTLTLMNELLLNNGSSVVYYNSANNQSLTLTGSSVVTTYTLNWPTTIGATNQLLTLGAGGQLGWSNTYTPTAGIYSLNGQTGPTQTMVVGTGGLLFNISSSGNTHTFNLPSATTANVTAGTISNALVTTYNNTVSTVNSATSAPTANTLVLRDNSGSFTTNNLTLMSELLLNNGSSVVYYNSANNQSLTLTGSSVVTTYTLNWPTAIGATNQLLTLGVGGQLGWSTMFTPTAGIYSLNTLTVPVQTFVTDQSTPNFHITSSGSTHTFSLPSANNPATTDGTISNSQVVNYNTAYSAVSTATSNNVANTLVLRDGSGNFSAGTITANLTGTATFATNAQTSVFTTTAQYFTGGLNGDVTGTEFSTVVSFVGGQSAANVASATTQVLTATSAPTPNILVLRDNTGSFTTNALTLMNVSSNVALIADSTQKIAASVTTSTELGYVSGVTSPLQAQINGKVSKSGDTMTGTLVLPDGTAAAPSLAIGTVTTGLSASTPETLVLSTNGVGQVSISPQGNVTINTPSSGTALTVQGAGAMITGTVSVVGGIITTPAITITNAPVNPTDGTNKQYVDSAAQGLSVKNPSRAVAVGVNETLSGFATIDGVTTTTGDQVCLTSQTNGVENGLWLVGAGAWTRPTNFANGSNAQSAYTFIQDGLIYADSSFICTTTVPNDIIGTDTLTFVEFSAAQNVQGINLGAGAQIFAQKVGSNLQFRTLTSDSNLLLTQNTDTVNIAFNSSISVPGGITSTGGTVQAVTVSDGFASMTGGNISGVGLLTTNTIRLGNGSASAPSLQFSASPNTGLYSPSANALALSANGVAALSIANTDVVSINNLSTGVVHAGNTGALTSSLIVDADIALNTITDDRLQTISTAGKVANSATTATSVNTPNTIVLRDGSGNFSANTITANLTGTASYATNAGSSITTTSAQYFTVSLAGDVTGPQLNTTVAFVGGQSAANVASATNKVLAATSAPTANTLVLRDAAGSFTTNTLTLMNGLLLDNGATEVYFNTANNQSLTLTGSSVVTTYTLNWPTAAGGAGQVLSTDVNGQLGWSTMYTPTAGIYSLDGLTAPNQSFAVGFAGTTLNIVSTGTVHTFNLPSASTPGVVGGTLTYALVTTYNNAVSVVNTLNSGPAANSLVFRDATGSFTTNNLTLMDGLLLDNGALTVYYNSANNQSLTLTGSSVVTTYTLNWPTTIGTTNQLLTLGAGGQLGWSTMYTPTAGIYSLNGLTTPVQTFTTNQSTPNFHITSSGSTHTFSLPSANNSATTDGTISNTQVVAYNSAVSTINSATSAPTANTLVLRDAAGSFTTNTLTLMNSLLLDKGGLEVLFNTANNQSITLTGSSVVTTYTLNWPTAIGATNQLLTLGAGGQLGWSTMYTPTAGIYSLNTLTGPIQTFTVGTAGTSFGISSSGTTHTFNLPSANSVNVTSGTITNTQVVAYNGAVSTINSATSAPTANTLVLRDAAGSFTTNTLTLMNNLLMDKGGTQVLFNTANTQSITLTGSSVVTTYTLNWPTAIGATNQLLTLGAGGQLGWSTMYTPTAGIYTLNNQTGPTQSFATNQSGTSFSISSASNVHTFSLPSANSNGTTDGTLSNTQVVAYNAAVSTINSATSASIANTLVLRDSTSSFSANNISALGNLQMPATTATTGQLQMNNIPVLHTFGTNSMFAGLNAGNLTLTGVRNTGFGQGVLTSITTGSSNTGVGYEALGNGTVGYFNVGVGALAMRLTNTPTAFQNTAVGQSALNLLNCGDSNVAIGFNALTGTLTACGSSNIAIGANAGTVTGNHPIGSNNIYIGSTALTNDASVCRIANIQSTVQSSALPAVTVDSNNLLGVGSISLPSNRSIVFGDSGSHTVTLSAPSTMSANYTLSWPTAMGTTGQALVTDGVGNLSWGGTALSTANTLVLRDNTSSFSANNISALGVLQLPTTTATTGQVQINNTPVLHTYGPGTGNLFVGFGAGNFSLIGNNNTGVGSSALVNNSTGGSNVAVGEAAMVFSQSASQNTAIGVSALSNNLTGSGNIALGYNALNAATGPFSATAIGSFAMSSASTSALNPSTAVGYAALQNDSGGYNTAVGYAALSSNTTGTGNIGIGFNVLQAPTGGFCHTAIGTLAMSSATTAAANPDTAIGYAALQRDTGGHNTAVGYLALNSNSSGSQNTSVGDQSMFHTTTGGTNTVVGYGALFGNVGGSQNVAIGYGALGGVTGGTGNIALGYNAGVSAGNSVTGNVYIGVVGAAGDPSNTCYIKSIAGVSITGGSTVFINGGGQLGTSTSSRRYKTNITNMLPSAGALIDHLQPVRFNYKHKETGAPFDEVSFGLIAEEVAELDPDLVIFNEDGLPETVRYHYLDAFYIAKMQELQQQVDDLYAARQSLERELAALREMVVGMRA